MAQVEFPTNAAFLFPLAPRSRLCFETRHVHSVLVFPKMRTWHSLPCCVIRSTSSENVRMLRRFFRVFGVFRGSPSCRFVSFVDQLLPEPSRGEFTPA